MTWGIEFKCANVRDLMAKQKLRRKGFASGLFAGILFAAYKVFKYPGSIARDDVLPCVAVVLSFGLVGGLIGSVFGAFRRSSGGKDGH